MNKLYLLFLLIIAASISGCDPDEEVYVRDRINNGSIVIERRHSQEDIEKIVYKEVQEYRRYKEERDRCCVDSNGRSVCK
jgi:hypothetical protein